MVERLRTQGNCPAADPSEPLVLEFEGESGMIHVTATINDSEGKRLLLDTGATFVSIPQSMAADTNFSMRDVRKIQLQTANGITEGKLTRADRIAIGPLAATNVPVIVVPDENLGTDNALLGMSFLSRFKISVDSGARKLTLTPR